MWSHGNVDKDSLIPIYHQIAQILKEYIHSNKLGDDDLMPSERELCEAFDTSRMTVRQAVDLLVNEELLVRRKGKGTFVKMPKLRQHLTTLTSFTVDMTSQGMVPTSQMICCKIVVATRDVASRLNLQAGDKVIQIERVRLANGRPHAFERSFLLYPEAILVLDEDFTNRSLYHFLCERCGMKLVKAKELIEVTFCPDEICELLLIAKRSHTFHMERLTYDYLNRPVEYVVSYYCIDKFKFEVELDLEARKTL